DIRLMALKAGKLSEMVSIDPVYMSPELYDENQEVYNLGLKWTEEESVDNPDGIQLHQNRPNPWIEETMIPFEIPEAGEVTVTITDAQGKTMTTITKDFAAGKQQLKILNDSWPPGVYYYTVHFGDTQLTKTMLILNKR
ncbi:MAG TPA: T9SS type A sorting domain-containing protein, partial [Saprospiraceae bacterium]|nr:T9SS type A sorting domain-containing protein [Saprospiraceae bacterium]